MESAQAKVRHVLALGKYRVVRVDRDFSGPFMVLDLGNSVKMTVSLAPTADVREGDLLTLYTEVLAHDPTKQTPLQ